MCSTRASKIDESHEFVHMSKGKQRFPTLAKENQSSLGFYRNPPTFLFINPRFVLLIRDQYSVLLSFLVRYYSRNANVLSHPLERLPQYDRYRKWEKSVGNMDIFLMKTHVFATGGLYSPLESRVMHILLWMRVFYLTSCVMFNRNSSWLQW